VGTGCDSAVYMAAGCDELLRYREEKIGFVPEGEAFITPAFKLQAKYIIHAVSPHYVDGNQGEEEKLRSCYRKSLQLAKENGIRSISFPLISTGGFGYPKEEGMRIAVDEINAFLLHNEMDIFLVVFDAKATQLGEKIYPGLEAYIDHNYVKDAGKKEYGDAYFGSGRPDEPGYDRYLANVRRMEQRLSPNVCNYSRSIADEAEFDECDEEEAFDLWSDEESALALEKKLNERLAHKADTFSEYLLYLIASKNMTNVEVYKRACLTKQYFHKLNKNKNFHPEKSKALLLCVGAKLNLDETKDLLARAGYALSPADLTDIIFSFFIEHKHYDVIDIDIQLEEHGLPCIIS
ncbi:MAG: macro domain-containing protein, partial [Clostridiales bacterium]|nr:macro domain-containing protein [Clostridiales bacterium]